MNITLHNVQQGRHGIFHNFHPMPQRVYMIIEVYTRIQLGRRMYNPPKKEGSVPEKGGFTTKARAER